MWDTILSGNSWKGVMINRKKDQSIYYEEQSVTPIINEKSEITHFVAIKSDISERMQFEADLIQAKEKAEAGDNLKTAFINNISHEVRTPLNGILGFTELIVQPHISDTEKEEYHLMIKNSSKRLINTITSYMDISMLSSGNIQVNPGTFDLLPLLSDLEKQYQPLSKSKQLKLSLKVPDITSLMVNSDKNHLNKVLSHLLDNALKFTKQGEIVFGYSIKPEVIEFFIKDTGAGVSKEAQERIFESFVQEEMSNTRGHEGSGLGLSIVKGLLKLLDGDIRLESQKGIGSTFFVTIPYYDASPVHLKLVSKEAAVNKSNHPVILIAEDDEVNSIYLQTILKISSYATLVAMDGKEAVELCRQHPEISLVLMDIKMPVMDGMEATREIKSFRENLPIIATTAFAMNEDIKKAKDAGCDDYLAKPVSKEVLIETLKKHGAAAS